MATFAVSDVEILGRGVQKAEGVVVDKDNNVYGGGRNGVMYKVDPAGKVSELCTLPAGSIPNGVTMDRAGNIVYCDLGKQAVMRVSQAGQVSLIADRVGDLGARVCRTSPPTTPKAISTFPIRARATFRPCCRKWPNPSRTARWSAFVLTAAARSWQPGFTSRTGRAIDPQEEAVYVLESTRMDCLRIAIKKDGTFGKPKSIPKAFPRCRTGWPLRLMATCRDAAGVYSRRPNGAGPPDSPGRQERQWTTLIDDAKGEKLDFPTNCAFGGPGLRTSISPISKATISSRVHTNFVGHPLYHQR